MLEAEIITRADQFETITPEWDELAVSCGRPFCAPAWMMAWWREVAPPDAMLRCVVVTEFGRLVGLAPLWAERGSFGVVRYRPLGAGTSLRAEPLASRTREPEVATAIMRVLFDADPRPDVISFEGIPERSQWPRLMLDGWPGGRGWMRREWNIPAPTLDVDGESFDSWFSSKSSNFREQMRRARRKLAKSGVEFRMSSDPDEVARDLKGFAALHYGRWETRGGSQSLDPSVERMLEAAGRKMVEESRFRLWSGEVDGRIVSSHLFIEAGGELAYWLGGFDEKYSAMKPALVTILIALEDAWERGLKRVDLGGGGQDYKYRFATGEEELEWWGVVPPGPKATVVRARAGMVTARRKVLARMSSQSQARIRRLFGRKVTESNEGAEPPA